VTLLSLCSCADQPAQRHLARRGRRDGARRLGCIAHASLFSLAKNVDHRPLAEHWNGRSWAVASLPDGIVLECRPANTEGAGQLTQRDLVRTALRMPPDRICVGEIRGVEAFDVIHAMASGTSGSLSTIHAESAREALQKLGMHLLAAEPNVVCKISSLGMRDPRWTVASLQPWVIGCIKSFGTDRCFFGSNWPVDSLFSSYGALLDAYEEIIAGYSEEEQAALMSGNAERIFRI